jgi:hypothetical protein
VRITRRAEQASCLPSLPNRHRVIRDQVLADAQVLYAA